MSFPPKLPPVFAWSTTTNLYLTRSLSIPLKRPFRFTDLPGSVADNHEDRDKARTPGEASRR